jgi:hypothetical protein
MIPRKTSRVNAAQSMLLDCAQYQTFIINLGTSVQTLRTKDVSPGQLYVFVAVQDSVGYRELNWGDRIRNGIQVDQSPNSITVQSYVGITGGILQAVPPGAIAADVGPPGPPGPPGPQGPPGPTIYPAVGVAVSTGTEWDTSIDPATLATVDYVDGQIGDISTALNAILGGNF